MTEYMGTENCLHVFIKNANFLPEIMDYIEQKYLGSFCLTVEYTGVVPAQGLEAQAWSN